MNFKNKLFLFLTKKWTAPVICSVCIVLIFAMSANSFARYYTRITEERMASVAVYGANVDNAETLWYKQTNLTAAEKESNPGVSYIYKPTTSTSTGRAKIVLHESAKAVQGKIVAEYFQPATDNTAGRAEYKKYSFCVANKVNDKVCEVALKYTITVTFPNDLPVGVSWTVDGGTYYSNTTRTQTFTGNSYTLPAGIETVKNHTVDFKFTQTTENILNTQDVMLNGVTIKITTTQITD